MVFCLGLRTRFGARQALWLPAEKQAHVWPTLPLRVHSPFGLYVGPQRFNLESFKRPLSWISRVSRWQLSLVHHHASSCFRLNKRARARRRPGSENY